MRAKPKAGKIKLVLSDGKCETEVMRYVQRIKVASKGGKHTELMSRNMRVLSGAQQ